MLLRNGRRVVVAGWASALQMFASLVAERDALRAERAEIRADRDELRERLMELCDAIRARQAAEAEVRELYRLREIERARKAVRDPSQPLQ